jgi:hypothetical protein
MSLKVGNAGLNIDWINHAVFYDLWWNPQIHSQAEHRIIRPRQEKDVHIHYLIIDHTIELYIMNLLHEKKRIADSLDSKDESIIKREDEEAGESTCGLMNEGMLDQLVDLDSTEELTLDTMGITEDEACKLFDYDVTIA